MGRGYSATRTSSARPTLKMKRQRSLSAVRSAVSRSASRTSSVPTQVAPQPVAIARMVEEEDIASEDDDETVERQLVVTKYKAAGAIVDVVLSSVALMCIAGSNTFTLTKAANDELQRRTQQTFAKQRGSDKKPLPRGICFPCNISVNNIVCNHAPTRTEEGSLLKPGDVVKIHLGVHIDGYPCTAARTVVVAGETSDSSSEASANCIEAARVALLGMLRLMKPGVQNGDVTDFLHSVGHYFETQPLEGVLSTRTKRWLIDGMQAIITRRVTLEDPQQDVEEVTIRENQVWTLDVAFTTGTSYKTQPSPTAPSIFRKNELEMPRDPRLTAASDLLNEIKYNLHCFPFHLSQTANPLKSRLGIAALRNEAVLDAFPEIQAKGSRCVTARFSATICVAKNRINVFCGLPSSESAANARNLSPELTALLEKGLTYTETTEKAKKRLRTEKLEKSAAAQ